MSRLGLAAGLVFRILLDSIAAKWVTESSRDPFLLWGCYVPADCGGGFGLLAAGTAGRFGGSDGGATVRVRLKASKRRSGPNVDTSSREELTSDSNRTILDQVTR